MTGKPDTIALDRDPAGRTIDQDGHLHVPRSNISRACVNGYAGKEIPDYEALGLDPDRLYQLLRDPAELEKAAPSFDGKPLLIIHRPLTAATHPHEITVGSVVNPAWAPPFLTAELHVWDDVAIAGINSGEQCELSAGYRYRAVMEPGEYEGARYDGRMTEIVGNHIALVEAGRAGPKVVVGDAAIPDNKETHSMAKHLSRAALLATSGLRQYLKPKLAMDAKIDVVKLVAGVTAKTFAAERPKLKLALDAAVTGKLGKDASLSDVDGLLDELQQQINDLADEPEADPGAEDEAETEEEKKARMEKRAADKSAKDKAAKDEAEKSDKDKVTKPAMDAAIGAAVAAATVRAEAATIARMRAIQAAEREVRPHVGELVIGQDSAAAVYRLALDAAGVDLTDVPEAAYGAMVKMLPKPGAAPGGPPRIAMDAAGVAALRARFPGAASLKIR